MIAKSNFSDLDTYILHWQTARVSSSMFIEICFETYCVELRTRRNYRWTKYSFERNAKALISTHTQLISTTYTTIFTTHEWDLTQIASTIWNKLRIDWVTWFHTTTDLTEDTMMEKWAPKALKRVQVQRRSEWAWKEETKIRSTARMGVIATKIGIWINTSFMRIWFQVNHPCRTVLGQLSSWARWVGIGWFWHLLPAVFYHWVRVSCRF